MKYKVSCYRTLEFEDEIEAESLEEAKEMAASLVTSLPNSDFSAINEEFAEIIDDEMQYPERVETI